jgi:putative oxidoreductase
MKLSEVGAGWRVLGPFFHSALRIVAAFVFILAGLSKLFAWPQAMLPSGAAAHFPTQPWFAGVIETVGGAFVLIGLCARPIAFVMAGEMAVAYFHVHAKRGFWPTANGGMAAVLFCFIWLFISAAGAGPISIDTLRRK